MNGMRGASTLMLIWLAVGLGAAGAREGLAQGGARGAGFVPLAEFLPGVAAARFEGFPRGPETRVRTAEAFAEMRLHILSLYEGVGLDGGHSFLLDGQHFDCLPIEQQPSGRGRG